MTVDPVAEKMSGGSVASPLPKTYDGSTPEGFAAGMASAAAPTPEMEAQKFTNSNGAGSKGAADVAKGGGWLSKKWGAFKENVKENYQGTAEKKVGGWGKAINGATTAVGGLVFLSGLKDAGQFVGVISPGQGADGKDEQIGAGKGVSALVKLVVGSVGLSHGLAGKWAPWQVAGRGA